LGGFHFHDLQVQGVLHDIQVGGIHANAFLQLDDTLSFQKQQAAGTVGAVVGNGDLITLSQVGNGGLCASIDAEGLIVDSADGYQMGTPAINPEQVLISGSLEQVNRVARVMAVLERKDLKERFAGDLPLTLLDASGEVIEDLEVTLDNNYAYVVVPVVVVKEIPLTVNFLLGGGVNSEADYNYTIKPQKIIVSGQEEDLQNLTEISLGSIDLSKIINSKTISKEIVLDPSLENVSGITTVNIDVTIKNLSTRTFEVDNIQLSNVPQGYRVTTVTQIKMVMVRGHEEDLNLVDPSQIRIVADMSDYHNEGTYSVPARVYLDASNSVGVIGDYVITVHVDR